MARDFFLSDYLFFVGLGRMEWAHMPDYLVGVDQKIPHFMFLREVNTTVRSGIESRFDIMGFYHE